MRIKSHITASIIFSALFFAISKSWIIFTSSLKTKAAVLGADAVILTDEGFTVSAEFATPKYWATGVAVKFK